MSPNNWVLLCRINEKYKADLLTQALREKQIPFRVINKVDSAFNFMGGYEIYTQQSKLIIALRTKEKLDL